MAKTITLEKTGYHVIGRSKILCWGGDVGFIDMDPFDVDSLDEIPDRINDGQFGCQAILEAECNIYEDYEGVHRYLKTRTYKRDEIGMNAPRGIRKSS